MDTGDLLLLGAVGVGGYFAWRWYKRQPVTDAQRTAPKSTAGIVASDMTAAAARSTAFGGPTQTRNVFPRLLSKGTTPAPKIPPTALASTVADAQRKAYNVTQAKVLSAVFAPVPTAPAPNTNYWVSDSVVQPQSTAPSGEGTIPGDPFAVFFTRGLL